MVKAAMVKGGEGVAARMIPVGAEVLPEGKGVHFRVWAPGHTSLRVEIEGQRERFPLHDAGNGYFEGELAAAAHGTCYKYEVDGGESFPDPASRFQPNGPHGFSEIIDPARFRWTDENWPGVKLEHQIIYELHVGSFTQLGTWAGATERLEYLRDTGITVIEVMPVSNFPGRFGWGYDGVQPYAPATIYGRPDDFRAFVNKAHAVGLGVILDVVYNHLGPDGNYLTKYSPHYFTDKYETDWGAAINFDGEQNGPVREFFRENAAYWIREFHLDGLRLDATQDVHDDSHIHILAEITKRVREAAGTRSIVMIAENEPQDVRCIRPLENGGFGLDALWNDDYHHAAMVTLTGKTDAYYHDYRGTPQEFISAVKHGYLFQGQWYGWQRKRRGTATFGLPRAAMVNFIQNHDQVANSARGQRLHEISGPGQMKALTALTLLAPGTPMIFQGQEFAASAPFLFFADHRPDLAKQIRNGRIEFLQQWSGLRLPEMRKCFDDPAARLTFERCILDHTEVRKHSEVYALHRDLLKLRKTDPVISRQGEHGIDGAVLSEHCFVIRYFSPAFDTDRLLLVNLGTDLDFSPVPEPLLAPPLRMKWSKLWSSDDPEYGGCGTPDLECEKSWKIPGFAAVVLLPQKIKFEQKTKH